MKKVLFLVLVLLLTNWTASYAKRVKVVNRGASGGGVVNPMTSNLDADGYDIEDADRVDADHGSFDTTLTSGNAIVKGTLDVTGIVTRSLGTGSVTCTSTSTFSGNMTVNAAGEFTGGMTAQRGAINLIVYNAKVAGDANNRWEMRTDGSGNPYLNWGNGTDAVDTNLYRSAANTLKTDDAFTAVGEITGNGTIISVSSGVGFGFMMSSPTVGMNHLSPITSSMTWTEATGGFIVAPTGANFTVTATTGTPSTFGATLFTLTCTDGAYVFTKQLPEQYLAKDSFVKWSVTQIGSTVAGFDMSIAARGHKSRAGGN